MIGLLLALMLPPTIGTDFAPLTNNCIAPRVAVDLAGTWKWSTDGQTWKDVTVPCKNRVDADVVHQFRRTFTTPKDWKAGDRALVNFEVIGYDYEVFVNGERAAAHGYSYNIPQRVDVSRWTKPGENELLVKTVRPGKNTPGHEDEFRDFPKWSYPEPWCPLGIVMPVHLEFTGPVSVEGVFVKPRVEGGKRLEVEVCVTNSSQVAFKGSLSAQVKSGVEVVQWSAQTSVGLGAGEAKVVTLKGDWPEAHLWTPDDPHLYNLDVSLAERATPLQDCRGTARTALAPASQLADARRIPASRQVDACRVRFGFREIKVKGHRFFLNGHPFIARASTHLPDQRQSADDYRAFFARCKAAGVNSFRSRYREHARTLELADECGVFIMPQAMDSWCSNRHSPIFWQRFHQELREMVRAYRNHPSVLYWGLSNEFGTFYSGALGKKGPEGEKEGTDRQAEAGAVLTAEDPTRVWTACGDVDLCYPARGRNGPAPTRSFHYPVKYCLEGWELPMTNSVYWYLNGRESWQNNSEKDKPLCITEDLYHGVLDQPLGFSKYAGDAQWTIDGWCRTLHWIVHQVAAGFYTSGLGWWDLWTVEKGSKVSHYRDYGQMMPDFLVAMVEPPRNVRAGERVTRTVRAFNETFAAQDCSLTLNGREIAALTLEPGEFAEKTVSLVAPNDQPDGSPWSWKMRLVDRKTGAALTEETFEFRVFAPEKPLTLPKAIGVYARKASPLKAMAAEDRVYDDVKVAVEECRYLIVDEVLASRDRDLLERFVRGGGRVLYFPEQDASAKSAEPFELQRWAMQTFVWRRDPEAMKSFPEEAFRLWMPDGLVGRNGLNKPEADCDILWDSGSGFGLEYAQIARIYRGAGSWLVCVPPVIAKYHEEPCCPALFLSLLRELASKKTRPAGTVRVTSAAEGGELAKIFAEMGVATNGTVKSAVRWIDASQGFGKDLQKVVLDVERKGGLVIVTDLPADADPEFLGRFGLRTELPKTGVRTLHPFMPSWIGADSDSDQGVKWVTIDKANAGLLKGVSNEDVFWWEPGDFVGYIPNLIVGFPPRGAAWNSKERNVMVACTAILVARGASAPPTKQGAGSLREPKCLTVQGTGSLREPKYRATLHTIPAAWAEAKVGKGRVVLSTMKIAGSSQKARKRVKRFLRRVLMNAGVRTSEDPEQVFWNARYVDLSAAANRGYWGNDKAFLGDPTADLRYFPVNLCGWSQISRAPCPREEFPERALNLAGESFRLLDPEKNGGKGLIFLDNNDSVTVDLGKGVRFDELHLLLSHAGPGLKVAFDDGAPLPVEHTGPFLYKKGEPCGKIVWQGKTDDGRDTVLYRTVVKNPQPDRLVRKLVFSNPTLGWRKSKPAAILAVTMKTKVNNESKGTVK